MPVRSARPDAVTIERTVISFCVSVPVLSLAITVAEPSVSTAASRRTMALRFAMRCMPSDSTTVVTAASPSGTAETASDTVYSSTPTSTAVVSSRWITRIVTPTTTAMAITIAPRMRPSRSSSRCSGVRSCSVARRSAAILPNSVSIPVAVTTARPWPNTAFVPA